MTTSMVVLPNHHLPQTGDDRLPDDAPTPDELCDALDRLLSDRPTLRDWLAGVLENPEFRARVARDSYWHANGFAKLVLHHTDRFRLRLHVWQAGLRGGESDPHGHRWAFASAVLTGAGLSITEHQEVEVGVPHIRYHYDGQHLSPEGTHMLDEGTTREVLTHERYVTDTGTVHTVRPLGEELVATLIVQGRQGSDTTVVYPPELVAQAVARPSPRHRPLLPRPTHAQTGDS